MCFWVFFLCALVPSFVICRRTTRHLCCKGFLEVFCYCKEIYCMYQDRRLSHSSSASVFAGLKFRCMVCCCVYVCGVSFWLCLKYIILTFAHSLAHNQGFFAACGQIFGYGSISAFKGSTCLILGSNGDSSACVQNGITEVDL